MGFRDQSLSLNWNNLFQLDTLVGIILGFILMILVMKKPKLFWPLLIIFCIIGIGPRIKGYFFIDEVVAIFLMLGAVLHLHSINKSRKIFNNQHNAIWFLWLFYMICESVIGILVNDDLRIFRWVIFYFLLIMIAIISNTWEDIFPKPDRKNLAKLIVITSTFYFIIYLGQGMYFEDIIGMGESGRFLSQDNFWSGSAYAVFPMIIAIPSSIEIIQDKNTTLKIFGWFSIFLMFYIAFYYDSRISWIVILGGFLFSLHNFTSKSMLSFFFILTFFFFTVSGDRTYSILEDVFETGKSFNNPNKSNIGRNLATKAGIEAWLRNPKTFLIGDGMYSHKKTAIPFAERLYAQYMPEDDFHVPGSRDDADGSITSWNTTSFVGWIVDTGLIGIIIFILTILIVIKKIIAKRSQNKGILLFSIFVILMWLLINNITDILLFYLIIMPNGIIFKLQNYYKY